MAVWYSLWSFVIFFPIWNVWTKKNLATLTTFYTYPSCQHVSMLTRKNYLFQNVQMFKQDHLTHICIGSCVGMDLTKVTKWVWKNFVQDVAQRIFVNIDTYLTCAMEKNYHKNLRWICSNFLKTVQSKQPPNRRYFAQSGHPDRGLQMCLEM
jgi:hypothetical protein